MSELIIICYGYDHLKPNNANAICINEILNDLSQEKKILILTGGVEDSFTKRHLKENITICSIPSQKKSGGKINFKKWNDDIIKYIKKRRVLKKNSILMTISFPFPVHEIGLKLKLEVKTINWIVYELDPYAYNEGLRFHRFAFIYRIFKENRILNNADQIMLTHELYSQYTNNKMSKYIEKSHDIGIPLLKINNKQQYFSNKRNIINFVFTGSINNIIRNPDYMFELFSELPKSMNFEINLYGPEKRDINERSRIKLGKKLKIHGRVEKKIVEEAILKADFLINIGNTMENQLPSKVLEYIGTGRPIINFYSIDKDTSNHYLQSYPLSLLIKKDNNRNNLIILQNFISENFGASIESELVKELFLKYTKEEVIKRIEHVFLIKKV